MTRNKMLLLACIIIFNAMLIGSFIFEENPARTSDTQKENTAAPTSFMAIVLLILIHVLLYKTAKEQERRKWAWTLAPLGASMIFLIPTIIYFQIYNKTSDLFMIIIFFVSYGIIPGIILFLGKKIRISNRISNRILSD